MLDEADVIVCGAIGKDISGAGFDPNILGRSSVLKQFVLHIPRYQRLVLCDVTPASHGNGIGVGLFDVITKRSPSSSTSNPCTPTPSPATVWATRRCPAPWTTRRPPSAWRSNAAGISTAITPGIIRIQNTLHLGEIEVSEALLDAVRADSRMSLIEN